MVEAQQTPVAADDIERFMGFVEKLRGGCWYWTGARSCGQGNRKMYGSFRVGRRVLRAHKFRCMAFGAGVVEAGQHIDHRCGFSLCVNPDHLKIVPARENLARRWQRARGKKPALKPSEDAA